jgi:hypothetical protein
MRATVFFTLIALTISASFAGEARKIAFVDNKQVKIVSAPKGEREMKIDGTPCSIELTEKRARLTCPNVAKVGGDLRLIKEGVWAFLPDQGDNQRILDQIEKAVK